MAEIFKHCNCSLHSSCRDFRALSILTKYSSFKKLSCQRKIFGDCLIYNFFIEFSGHDLENEYPITIDHVVRWKEMFSLVSVILLRGEGRAPCPTRHQDRHKD